ncbi:MAG: T9SS type A sorting domain-containing protein [Crocinitomicaceae bacterium]|tara:strand:+ start:89967 stop:91412 length:1446 start_codon:yes stop_codon:yes gene_type:complete
MRLHLILLLLFSSSISRAQTDTFTHGGNDDDIGYCFALNNIGGYILAGSERTAIDSSEQFSIVNIDGKGNIVWKKTYGGIHHDIAEHIEQTTDGGYIVAGNKWDGGFARLDGYMMKLNQEGEVEWTKYHGGSSREEIFSVKQTMDGGYAICGYTNSDTIFSFGQMYIVKTDNLGNEEWRNYVGGPGKDYAFDIIETSDGSFVVTGVYAGFHRYSTFEFTHTHSDMLVAKLDANGNELWANTYGGIENELSYQVKEADDQGYYVIGSTQSSGNGSFDMNLIKLNENGTELWSKTYGNSGFEYGKSIDLSEDGFIYLTGSASMDTLTYQTDVIVIKTDLLGNEIWSITLGGNKSDCGNFIRATEDGGCAIIGNSKSFGAGDDDIYFVKLSKNGLLEPLSGSEENNMFIYPNPAVDNISFYIQEGQECLDYNYEIFDERGRLIYALEKNTKLVNLDVSAFGQGTYIYRITSPCSAEFRGKFIVY